MSRPQIRFEPLPLAFVVLSFALTAYYWGRLPDPMVTHWGLDGKANGWAPRAFGGAVGPAVTLLMYGVFTALPRLDPRVARWESSGDVMRALTTLMTAFGCFITYIVLSSSTSAGHQLDRVAFHLGTGAMVGLLGNYLPKLRSNFFMGIRTPWTLSNEEVWYRTHRLGGRLMVACGVIIVAGAWLPASIGMALILASLVGMAIATCGYSYWLYQRLGTPVR